MRKSLHFCLDYYKNKYLAQWSFILNRAKWQLWDIGWTNFLYFYTIRLKKIKQKMLSQNEKSRPADLQKSLKTKKLLFWFYAGDTTLRSLICLRKKVILVLITLWSTMEFQRYANFFLILWEYKNSYVEKRRTNKRLIVDVRDAISYSSIDERGVNF